MQNKTLIIVIAALLISNLVLLGVYFFGKEDKRKGSGKNEWSPVEYMAKEIGFDSTQKKQFRDLWETVNKKNREMYDSIRSNREALYRNMKLEPQPDSLIEEITTQMANYEKQVSLNNYQHFRRVRAICNDTQQVKLDTVISRLAKRGKRR